MHPMQSAIKNRRAHALSLQGIVDDSKLDGAPKAQISDKDPRGDLAPDGDGNTIAPDHDVLELSGDGDMAVHGKPVAEEKAIHAKAGQPLQEHVAQVEHQNPEHEPIARGFDADETGHEQSDQDVESYLMSGHAYDESRAPKTLGARVRVALQSKKGK